MIQPRKLGTALAVSGVTALALVATLSVFAPLDGDPTPPEHVGPAAVELQGPPPSTAPAEAPSDASARGRVQLQEQSLDRRVAEDAGVLGATRTDASEAPRRELLLQVLGSTGDGGAVGDVLADDATVAGLDAALQGASGVQQAAPARATDTNGGIGGLIGSKSTQIGASGLAAGGSGLGGGGTAQGLGGLGTKGRGSGASGYGVGGGSFGAVGKRGVVSSDGVGVPRAAMSGDQYDAVDENPFHAVADQPLSTFSVDVDTASYANVRRFLEDGSAPPRDAVRIEELVNYFPYDYAPPEGGAPFATHAEVTGAPWADGHRLVRIGIKGKVPPKAATPPRNLVFLVDVSGSMSSADRLPLVQRGLELLARQLGPEDHVSLVVYAGAAGVVLEPTRGDRTETILAAIERLRAGGSTAGAAGIQAAYDLAERHFRKGAINRVILATDGDFNVGVSSEAELVRLIEKKRETGVFLTVLGVGRGNLQDAKMEQLADRGNGNYAYIDSFSEMKKVLGDQVGATLDTIAKDVKIQVEFNPALVGSYRLLGYENRVLATRDFDDDEKDAGEIGAGHTVTALYEVVPAALAEGGTALRYQERALTAAAATDELLTVKLRYKAPDGDTSKLLAFPVRDDGRTFSAASADTRWAASVAAYGMLLRGSPHKGTLDWAWVRDTARGALGRDPEGYRAEFLGLVEKARRLGSGAEG